MNCCVCSRETFWKGQANIFRKEAMWSCVLSLPNGCHDYKQVRRFYLPSKRKYETSVSCVVLGDDRAAYLVFKVKKNSHNCLELKRLQFFKMKRLKNSGHEQFM